MLHPICRRVTLASLVALSFTGMACAQSNTAPPLMFYAASSGKTTLDQGEGGGNPFASALIDLLGRPGLTLAEFATQLTALTSAKSRGRQTPQVPEAAVAGPWIASPKPETERRFALVFVFSDYQASGGAPSLPGAARDAQRIATALRAAGFDTEIALDPGRQNVRQLLEAFSKRSAQADIGLFYTTGHGLEVDGTVYVLPGDFPVAKGNTALASHALRLSDVAAAAKARGANFVFYGGCRDNPFQGK